jgi:PAS domain S-box-containing protein
MSWPLIQFLRSLVGSSEGELDPRALAARVEELTRENAQLEEVVATHRQDAEALRKTQADLARAQRIAKIGNWRWSIPRQELVEGSDAYAEIQGVEPSKARQLIDLQKERRFHPDDQDRVTRSFSQFDASGADYEIEYRIIRPDGETRHLREIGEGIKDESGNVIEQFGTIQDITELKRAEAELQQAHDELEKRVWARTAELQNANLSLKEEAAERRRVEAEREEHEMLLQSTARNSKIGYAVWDERKDFYSNVSEEFARIMGLTVEAFNDRYSTLAEDFDVIHPDDRDRYRAFDDAYNADPKLSQIEYRMVTDEGRIIHVREIMEPVHDRMGRLVQSILTNQDITEQKQTEEQLRQAQKMEAVGQLTGGIAHDFNNLLAVILGNLELVQNEVEESEQGSECVQSAIEAAERGAGLTQRLLAFSRKQALQPASVDANALVQDMLELLRRTLGEQIDIELVRDADLWQCLVDSNQLENALLNLAINARDAMPTGGKLTITTSNSRIDDDYAASMPEVEAGHYVQISVNDTGSGMPEETQRRAFEPFYTTKDVGLGSGLGLSMVYGFIKQSGGHVSVDSEPSAGTTIRLFLPHYSGEALPESEPLDPSESLNAKGEIVLVAEDDADLRALLLRVLKSLGYEVLEADSGEPALEILRSPAEIDLLLTDIVLPNQMSGRELAEEALQARPDLRVIYMSGYTEDEILHHRHPGDGIQFLQKPFRKADIARAVCRALSRDKPSH